MEVKVDCNKLSVEDYLREVAGRKITPGGGSASALVAASGAALNLMVINFGISPSAESGKIELLDSIKEKQVGFLNDALRLMNEDCDVFTKLMAAISERSDTVDNYQAAAEVPMDICRVATASMEIARDTLEQVKGFIIADIACSRNMLRAAFFSAKINVEMNIKGIGQGEISDALFKEIRKLENDIEQCGKDIDRKLSERGIVKGD